MSKRFKKNLIIGIVGLAIVFVLQNAAPVKTTIFFVDFEMPRALLIVATFGLGAVAGYLAHATGLIGKAKAAPTSES